MKKSSPVPASKSGGLWRAIAAVSLVANVVLLAWAWRLSRTPPTPPVQAVVPAPAKNENVRPKPTGPYAALGSYMAENNRVPDLGWSEAQFAEFLEGFRASYEGRGLPLDEDAKKLRDEISERVQQMIAKEQPDPVEDYFRTLRDNEGVSKTDSGLHYRITNEGTGPKAAAGDPVVISVAARQPDGVQLPELGRERVKMAVRDLLPGLAEGVQLMQVGTKSLLYLPPSLSFAPQDWPANVPAGMPIVFFVELHEIVGPAWP